MTVRIEVNVAGLDRLEEGLKVAPEVLEAESLQAMRRSVLLVEADVKALTPRRTGRLFASIGSSVRPGFGNLRGTVGTAVKYAPWVENGRGPIVAKHVTASGKPGFLKFRGRGGRVYFRHRVGPAVGKQMFRRGLSTAMPGIRLFFAEAARKAADSIKGK